MRTRFQFPSPRSVAIISPSLPHPWLQPMIASTVLDSADPAIFNLATRSPGPAGSLPLTDELLCHAPRRDRSGSSQHIGMGRNPAALARTDCLFLATHGGLAAGGGCAR